MVSEHVTSVAEHAVHAWVLEAGFRAVFISNCAPAQPDAAVEELEDDARPVLHAAGCEEDIQRALPDNTRHAAAF
jgi:hypothetical protein